VAYSLLIFQEVYSVQLSQLLSLQCRHLVLSLAAFKLGFHTGLEVRNEFGSKDVIDLFGYFKFGCENHVVLTH